MRIFSNSPPDDIIPHSLCLFHSNLYSGHSIQFAVSLFSGVMHHMGKELPRTENKREAQSRNWTNDGERLNVRQVSGSGSSSAVNVFIPNHFTRTLQTKLVSRSVHVNLNETFRYPKIFIIWWILNCFFNGFGVGVPVTLLPDILFSAAGLLGKLPAHSKRKQLRSFQKNW